jgi:ABC-type polysaccharide/polyol phosphate transport system ATPase subunit
LISRAREALAVVGLEGRGLIAAALELQRSRGAAAVIPHDFGFAQDACDHNVAITHGHVSDIGRLSLGADLFDR